MAEKLVLDKLKFNYDPEGDVLYINFDEPMAADDSDITDEGVIVRLRENRIVGFTVLNAQKVFTAVNTINPPDQIFIISLQP